jgi:peptidoglycan/LPS O-acetylase OafA/YrhL
MRLSEYARGRDNNFTLLRLLASLTVVLYHSGPALGVQGGREFLFEFVGRSFGEMALDMLFVTSGFLVTASLFNRGDLNHFLWARALRLYPALWLMLPLTVFLLAPALTTLPIKDYCSAKATWDYFAKNATIMNGIRYSLPGVFETLPLKGEFNGSLWTLPVEARMYVYLAVGWLAFSFTPKIRVPALSVIAPVAAAAIMAAILITRTRGSMNNKDVAVFMFFYGASLYFWRDKLFLNHLTFAALPLLVLAAAMLDRRLSFAIYLLCLPPFLLCLAYIPGGPIRSVNRWGDYSYGIYIYAFPVQQTLALFFPKLSMLAMAGAAGAVSFALAFCSWNLVEKRAMGLKDACAEVTARAFRTIRKRTAPALRFARPPPEGAVSSVVREALSGD